MRTNKIFIAIISIFLVLIISCSNEDINSENKTSVFNKKIELKNPPTLKVLYQDKNIEAKRGTYSWTIDNNDGTKATTLVDCSGPTELIKTMTPISVSPKSTLNLNFSDKPVNIIVNIWGDNKPIEQTIIDNNIITPELKGSVIYEVIATWEQGTVFYAFLVNID